MVDNNLSKYVGQYIAWIDEKIVAFGTTSLDVYKKARKISTDKLITLEYVPTKKETITFLWNSLIVFMKEDFCLLFQ